MAPKHHEPFKALGPIGWDSVPADAPDSLGDFINGNFTNAQTVIDSIPVPNPVKEATAAGKSPGRSRSHTDPPPANPTVINRTLSARQSAAAMSTSQDLMKEWKEVKVGAKENPLAINVYKLAAKDGRGAWFARRSIHDGMTFEKWKLGLEREFAESMKVQTGPGGGSIRGIGADKKAECHVVDGVGKAEVYQLSAQFPGPTAPRDFITLLLSSDASHKPPIGAGGQRPLRSFMILSKPCEHPDCPPQQGIIRGQYESVELIREVPAEKPATMRRARSSIDVSGEDPAAKRQSIAEDVGKEAVLRAAQQVAQTSTSGEGRHRAESAPPKEESSGQANEEEEEEDVPTTIEWLMVTRSDPGGNVPRFMIERGTPGGIVGDANKFLKWLTAKSAKDFAHPPTPGVEKPQPDESMEKAIKAEESKARSKSLAPAPTANLVPDDEQDDDEGGDSFDSAVPSSNGLYGIISGAFGYASSAIAGKLPTDLPGFFSQPNSSADTIPEGNEDEASSDNESDTSSLRSFTSAVEPYQNDVNSTAATDEQAGEPLKKVDSEVSTSAMEQRPGLTSSPTLQEKELRKLQERRRKINEKMSKFQSRMAAKRSATEDTSKDEAAKSKLREKHDREVAKQEEKYQRELRRLEEKREHDEKKATERRRKQAEKEEKANLGMEIEKVKSERDLALKQVELLKAQIGELQGQNTMLVAEMGRLGKSASGESVNGATGTGSAASLSRTPSMKRQDSVYSAGSVAASTSSKAGDKTAPPAAAVAT